MRYIITGLYANGDAYGEATESLADLAYILSDINRWNNSPSVGENLRVDADTVKIETEAEA